MNASAPRDSAAFEVREALEHSGCSVCRLSVRSVGRLLQSVAYEHVNDPGLRQQLRAARGFCNQHAYRWLREAHNVLGTAIIYREVLATSLRTLDESAASNGQRGGLLRGLRSTEDTNGARRGVCPACATQRDAEDRYLGALLASLAADDATRQAFSSSNGLCFRHTVAAIRRGGPAVEQVVDQTRHATLELIGHLDEVIRKEDYRFTDEPRTDEERVAPANGIAWAAGVEGLTDV